MVSIQVLVCALAIVAQVYCYPTEVWANAGRRSRVLLLGNPFFIFLSNRIIVVLFLGGYSVSSKNKSYHQREFISYASLITVQHRKHQQLVGSLRGVWQHSARWLCRVFGQELGWRLGCMSNILIHLRSHKCLIKSIRSFLCKQVNQIPFWWSYAADCDERVLTWLGDRKIPAVDSIVCKSPSICNAISKLNFRYNSVKRRHRTARFSVSRELIEAIWLYPVCIYLLLYCLFPLIKSCCTFRP